MAEVNLALDVDVREGGKPAARVAVAEAWAFTRHGGAAVVTRDCTSLAAFEREVERLKAELDATLVEARARFGGSAAPAGKSSDQAAPKSPRHLPTLDTKLRVADVMTREVRTLHPNDQLSLADELMKQGRFRHVVVVDEGRVVGVLSQRDVFHGALAWSLGQGKKAHQQLLAATPVKEVMASHVVTIDPDVPLAEAAALLREKRIGCLPVVAGDALVGILTEGDFLALLAPRE